MVIKKHEQIEGHSGAPRSFRRDGAPDGIFAEEPVRLHNNIIIFISDLYFSTAVALVYRQQFTNALYIRIPLWWYTGCLYRVEFVLC